MKKTLKNTLPKEAPKKLLQTRQKSQKLFDQPEGGDGKISHRPVEGLDAAGKGRTLDFPDDLALAQALSPRPARWTARELQKRLDTFAFCIKHDVVPDAKGRFRGLVDVSAWSRPSPGSNAGRRLLGVFKQGERQWESVPVPPELEKKMAGLAEAGVAVHELLEAGEIGKAGERMVGIEALVADMARRADPDRARGKKVLAGAILGKEMGGGRKAKVPTAELMDYYEASPKHTAGKTAQHFGMRYDTVKKRLQRGKKEVKK